MAKKVEPKAETQLAQSLALRTARAGRELAGADDVALVAFLALHADEASRAMTAADDPRSQLRVTRVLLLSATRELEGMLARTVFRAADEDTAAALEEYLSQVREHLMLAAFVDAEVDIPPAPDTDPPEPPPTTCPVCAGTGIVRDELVLESRLCTDCLGVGAVLP